VDAGVPLLHAAIVAAGDLFAGAGKERGADGDAALGQAVARFLKSYFQHPFAEIAVHHRFGLIAR